MCIVLSLLAMRGLLSNITLALELKETGRLKLNSIGRTLFFNALVPISLLAHFAALIAIILELDPNMDNSQHGIGLCLSFSASAVILSTLSVSVVWIIDVQKATAMRAGPSSAQQQERVLLAGLYIFSYSAATLVVISYAATDTPLRYITLVGAVYSACVGASYHFAGKRVLAHLHVADVSYVPMHSAHLYLLPP
jgi:hypothetical protein